MRHLIAPLAAGRRRLALAALLSTGVVLGTAGLVAAREADEGPRGLDRPSDLAVVSVPATASPPSSTAASPSTASPGETSPSTVGTVTVPTAPSVPGTSGGGTLPGSDGDRPVAAGAGSIPATTATATTATTAPVAAGALTTT